MRFGAVLIALAAGVVVPSTAAPPPAVFDIVLASDAAADVATRFCVDVLSRKVTVPAPGAETWWRGYKLTEGLPQPAMDALGREGGGLISRATLAHGVASDGNVIIALGGAAGETCRVIVYDAVAAARLPAKTVTALTAPSRGWKALPTPAQYAVADKQSFVLRRDGKPYLANLLTPKASGAVAEVIVVAAIPPQVTLPPGY